MRRSGSDDDIGVCFLVIVVEFNKAAISTIRLCRRADLDFSQEEK